MRTLEMQLLKGQRLRHCLFTVGQGTLLQRSRRTRDRTQPRGALVGGRTVSVPGELLLHRQKARVEIETCFQQAIEVAPSSEGGIARNCA